MCSCHSILECCVMFSGVKLSIRSFVLFLEWHSGEFHDVKKHYISYPNKSLNFCNSLLFLQNKARIADNLQL